MPSQSPCTDLVFLMLWQNYPMTGGYHDFAQTYDGKPFIHSWPYLNAQGQTIGIVARYQNGTDKKDIIPFFKPNGMGWKRGINLSPRPLFGLDRLAKQPKDKAVFIVEGEKPAAALQSLRICAVTSLGGCQMANKADWTPLNGYKTVYLLLDNDVPGESYAKTVCRKLTALQLPPQAKIVRLSGLPEKGDIVDWLQNHAPDWDCYQPFPTSEKAWVLTELKQELQKAVPPPDDWLTNSNQQSKNQQQPLENIDTANLAHDYPDFERADFYGIAKEVAELGSEQSEADPVAVYFSFLVAAAAMIGNYRYLLIGDSKHNARLFAALVGASSRARKGTSFKPVERIVRKTEEAYEKTTDSIKETLAITNGGLSSAEGLIWAVWDEAEETRGKDNKPLWEGVDDKRLLVVEEKLAQVFKVAKREGNTITPLLRKAYDGGTLAPMTKNNRLKATKPHINVLGHITQHELKSVLTGDDVYNGLANRFLWVCVRRTKKMAFPQPMDGDKVLTIAIRLAGTIKWIKQPASSEITLDKAAREYWESQYPIISADRHGAIGAVTARDEAHTVRLALLFCLLDDSNVITTQHIKAAIAVTNYSAASAEFIFTMPTDESPDAQKLLTALSEKSLSQTEISHVFGRNKTKSQLSALLTELQTLNKIRKVATEGGKRVMWEKI